MNFAKKMAGKAGETIGKGVKVVQDKAEEGQWKEKAAAAASSAGSKAKALYEDKTGRNAKVDSTVAKAGLTVAAGVAAASVAANAAVVGAAVAGVATAGVVAAEKAGYGKQVQQVKDGVAKGVSGAKELASDFTGGYKKGKAYVGARTRASACGGADRAGLQVRLQEGDPRRPPQPGLRRPPRRLGGPRRRGGPDLLRQPRGGDDLLGAPLGLQGRRRPGVRADTAGHISSRLIDFLSPPHLLSSPGPSAPDFFRT